METTRGGGHVAGEGSSVDGSGMINLADSGKSAVAPSGGEIVTPTTATLSIKTEDQVAMAEATEASVCTAEVVAPEATLSGAGQEATQVDNPDAIMEDLSQERVKQGQDSSTVGLEVCVKSESKDTPEPLKTESEQDIGTAKGDPDGMDDGGVDDSLALQLYQPPSLPTSEVLDAEELSTRQQYVAVVRHNGVLQVRL